MYCNLMAVLSFNLGKQWCYILNIWATMVQWYLQKTNKKIYPIYQHYV